MQSYIKGRDKMKFGPDLLIAIILFLVGLIIFTIFGVIPALIFWLFRLKRAKFFWMHYTAVYFSKFICWLLHVKVHITGNIEPYKKKGSYCFVANHTSFIDIPVLVGHLGFWAGFICKKELKIVPILNLWILAMNSVFIFRTNLKASKKSLEKGAANIAKGIPMCVFPEGTRSKTGEVAPFKRGAFRMAIKSDATVVPITIVGARQSFEWKKTNFKRIDCYVHISDPVEFKNMDRYQKIDAEEKVEKEIKETYDKLIRRLNEA